MRCLSFKAPCPLKPLSFKAVGSCNRCPEWTGILVFTNCLSTGGKGKWGRGKWVPPTFGATFECSPDCQPRDQHSHQGIRRYPERKADLRTAPADLPTPLHSHADDQLQLRTSGNTFCLFFRSPHRHQQRRNPLDFISALRHLAAPWDAARQFAAWPARKRAARNSRRTGATRVSQLCPAPIPSHQSEQR